MESYCVQALQPVDDGEIAQLLPNVCLREKDFIRQLQVIALFLSIVPFFAFG